MKKSSQTEQLIQKKIEEKRFLRRLHEKETRKLRNSGPPLHRHHNSHAELNPLIAAQSGVKQSGFIELAVPEECDLEKNKEELYWLIRSAKESVRSRKSVCLDFRDCKTIKPAALTFLLAQIHKLRMEFGSRYLTGTYPNSKKVENLLSETGFFSILGVKSRVAQKTRSRKTRYIRFKSDCEINSSRIKALREELLGDDLKMPRIVGKKIFRAISEAMTNVHHHAYESKSLKSKSLRGRWWLCGTLSLEKNRLTLIFYDAGVGIPRTLPKKYPIEMIQSVLSVLPGIPVNDGQMIAAAMQLGRTRTGDDNRGKGLLDLAKLIDQTGAGTMNIYSRGGLFKYSSEEQRHYNNKGFIEGTLIEWKIPLDKALEAIPAGAADDENDEN